MTTIDEQPGVRPHRQHAVTAIAIVIPARNEAALIGRCLAALESAIRTFDEAVSNGVPFLPEPVRLQIVVVVDRSDDDTAIIARQFDFVTVLESDRGNVGAARAVGIDRALFELEGDAARTWIANTDADSEVPPTWLLAQLRHAASGADVAIGTVQPRFEDLTAAQVEAWQRMNVPGVANGDVHGTNLGVRASAYAAVGGFLPLLEHEDVELVARLRGCGAAVVESAEAEVLTSGRQIGRTPGGYAGYLRSELVPTDSAVR